MKKYILPLLVLSFIVSGCVQLSPPEAVYRDVRVSEVTLQGVKLDFLFDVKNPNPIAVDITRYAYRVEINGRELLNDRGGGITIEANAARRIALPVMVRWENVIGSALGIAQRILAGNMYLDYKVDGSVTAGALGITATAPLSASGRVRIPKEALKI